MKILVTVSSRHSATLDLGAQLCSVLRYELAEAGIHARIDLMAPHLVMSVQPYDAVVVGSAIYLGRWLAPARRFVTDHADALRSVPVWLFSSGPVGNPLKPDGQIPDALAAANAIGARDHRVFPGRLTKDGLNLAERLTIRAVKAEEGDFRDFAAVRAWGSEIAAVLRPTIGPDPIKSAWATS